MQDDTVYELAAPGRGYIRVLKTNNGELFIRADARLSAQQARDLYKALIDWYVQDAKL